jgi:hypothetical protein
LELSKRFEELGVKQKSVYVWSDWFEKGKYGIGDRKYVLTGCEFSGEQTLLSLALLEVQSDRRVQHRQKNARRAEAVRATQCA